MKPLSVHELYENEWWVLWGLQAQVFGQKMNKDVEILREVRKMEDRFS